MRSIKLFFAAVFIVFILIAGKPCPAFSDPIVRISGGKMTLKANASPLHAIIEKIRDLGIAVEIAPGINPSVTADFEDREIQNVLGQIVGVNNYALVWTKSGTGQMVLSGINLFRQGRIDAAGSLSGSGNLDIDTDKATGALYVKNRLLIRFRAPVNETRIRRILKQLKATLKMVHSAMAIYEIILPEGTNMAGALALLQQQPGVGAVEPDYAYRVPAPVTYEGQLPTGPGASDTVPAGAAAVAVLDSGLSDGFLSGELNLAAFNAVTPQEDSGDGLGHGTQMALIASGQVLPLGMKGGGFSNPVISIRAFDDNGYTSNTVLLRSIDYAIAKGAGVLSLSWGSEIPSDFLHQAMVYAASKGLKVVAAAGNSPSGNPVYPAAYEPVIAVSALAPDGKAWDQSNYGDFVDIAAPGFANLPVGYKGDPGTYAGTSIATAYIAGQIASRMNAATGED